MNKLQEGKTHQDKENIDLVIALFVSTGSAKLIDEANRLVAIMEDWRRFYAAKSWNQLTASMNRVDVWWQRNSKAIVLLAGKPAADSELGRSWLGWHEKHKTVETDTFEKVGWEVQELDEDAQIWSKVEGLDETLPPGEQIKDAREHAAGPLRIGTAKMRGVASVEI